MSAANFPACLAFTLLSEGGWSDNVDDPGGATMRGVTLATFREFVPGASVADLKSIPDFAVSFIYWSGYWRPVHGDALPAGIDLMVFDFGVNAGPGRAVTELQQAVGVKADGVLGPISMAAIAKASVTNLISTLSAAQRFYYRSLPTYDVFGAGWMNRTDARVTAALKLASPKSGAQA